MVTPTAQPLPSYSPGTAPGAPPVADAEAVARRAIDERDYEGALEWLMRSYGTALYRYCRHQLGEEDLADEVHQTTFVQAFDALPGFQGRSSLRTWLFGIARHRCLDAAKIRRRRDHRFPLTENLPESPSPAPGPEEKLRGRRRIRALQECLATLAPRVRDSILLRFQQGLSYVEMGRLGGERPPTLQARVVRALPALRRCLEDKGVTP